MKLLIISLWFHFDDYYCYVCIIPYFSLFYVHIHFINWSSSGGCIILWCRFRGTFLWSNATLGLSNMIRVGEASISQITIYFRCSAFSVMILSRHYPNLGRFSYDGAFIEWNGWKNWCIMFRFWDHYPYLNWTFLFEFTFLNIFTMTMLWDDSKGSSLWVWDARLS